MGMEDQFHDLATLSLGKAPPVPIVQDGSQSHSGCSGEEKNLLRTEPGCHGRPPRSLFTSRLRQTPDPPTGKKSMCVFVRARYYINIVFVNNYNFHRKHPFSKWNTNGISSHEKKNRFVKYMCLHNLHSCSFTDCH